VTASLTPAAALSVLPAGLRSDLLEAFEEIVTNYRERRWEPSELNGGKLCEAVFTVVDGYLNGGQYAARATKPRRFNDACLALEMNYARTSTNHSARITIPRLMLGLYDVRNNRGVGHAGGDVDPNQMDATFLLYGAKWLVAEVVRLLHNLSTAEATALVDALVQREVAWIWSETDVKRVLKLGLTWKQQTLALLLSEPGPAAVDDLMRWLEHPQVRDYRKVLRQLHRDRQVEYDEAAQKVRLMPPGVEAAEALVASWS
jgi:hypothetical protein